MLYVVGIGLFEKHLTKEAEEIIKKADVVYYDSYTSKFFGEIKGIPLERKKLEEELEFLEEGKEKDVVILVTGHPFFATTHSAIVLESKKKKIPTKVVSGISIYDEILTKTGLSPYKIGGIVSIVRWEENYKPKSFYYKIKENKERGLHTICLLDIKEKENYYMSLKEAIETLEKIDSSILDWEGVALCNLCSNEEFIKHSTLRDLKMEKRFCSLVVLGNVSEMEKRFLEEFA